MKNFGYQEEPIKEGIDYVLGAFTRVAGEAINPSANWLAFKVEKEIQTINGADTFACVPFSILNCVETLANFLEIKVNYSDRFLAKIAGTKIGIGTSPQATCEALRKQGVCLESSLPLIGIKSVEEFYQPDVLPENLKREAKKEFIDKFDFRHEFAFTGQESLEYKQNQLKEALKRSPVEVSVAAWFFNGKQYYKPQGMPDNHSVSLISYEEGKKWVIFDSVEQDVKELEWNYPFGMAKVFYMFPISSEEQERRRKEKLNWIEQILAKIAKIIPMLSSLVKKKEEKPVKPFIDALKPEPIPEKYLWDTKENIKASIKKIAIKEKIDPELACRVAQCESNLNPNTKRINSPKSIDRGLYQWNNFWHPEITDEMAYNPEIACREFCRAVKKGHLNWWNASRHCWNVV